MDWTSISKAIETFLAAPACQLLLLIAFVGIVLWGLYALRRLEIANARSQREDDLEKARLQNEAKEDERRANSDANVRALLKQLADTQAQLTAIVSRLEPKLSESVDLTKDTKAAVEAVAISARGIHSDVRKSAVTLASKLDNANAEGRTRSENLSVVINNRAQETQKTVHAVGNDIQTSLTKQDGLLDQMLHKLGDVVSKVDELRTDIRANTTAQTHASLRKDDELKALTDIKHMMDEVLAGIVLLKKRGDTGKLDPAVVPAADPIAVTTAVSSIPKRNTDNLPPLPPTAPPVLIETPLTTPPEKHDTQPLPVIIPKDTPHA